MSVENGRKQNILIVHNYYQIPGGEDTVVANEKKMLEEHGHKVILYTRNNSELKEMSKFRKMLLPFTTVFNPRTYKETKRIIKTEHIEIVHVHNTLNLISPAVYYAAISEKVPIVQTIHNFRLLCPGATFYRDGHICEDCIRKGFLCAIKHGCYRGSKLQTLVCVISTLLHRMIGIYGKLNYICLTEFNKEKLLSLKQIKADNVFVKPNFVKNRDEYLPEESRDRQFVFVGRLDKLKGIDLLLNAWSKMGNDAPKLIICGTGPMEEWCKNFIMENHCNVELRGFVPNREAIKLIAESRGLILPTQWYEGFPMSIVEAYSVGTPVICSDLGNSGSIIKNGVTGIKIDFHDYAQVEQALKNCVGMCESTYDDFIANYTIQSNYERLAKVYTESRAR